MNERALSEDIVMQAAKVIASLPEGERAAQLSMFMKYYADALRERSPEPPESEIAVRVLELGRAISLKTGDVTSASKTAA